MSVLARRLAIILLEMLVAEALEARHIHNGAGRTDDCSMCHGWVDRKSAPSSVFYGCRNAPYHEERACRCEQCRTKSLVRQTHAHVCANPDCGHTQRICPRCGTGVL